MSTISRPLTLTHSTVTSMLMRSFQNSSKAFRRWIGLLLVVFILYGVTAEAAHRHGRIASAASNNASLVEPNSSGTIFSTTPGCSDCLICQLHQNFAATLLTIKPHDQEFTSHAHWRSSDPLSIHSISSSPPSGRAPPQAN